MPPSSLAKQSAIGRTFQLAADGDDAYKQSVFEAYGRRYPELVEATGAKNYDQLLEASYRQLAKETADQFHTLPVNMSYHRAGEGSYQSSGEMMRDIYGNRHLYVYQGGDPHDFLNAIDPETGLNTNEMFRAVHDFYGHAVHGNQFGPKGEEIAYGAHAQMFSPLARMAMASETRGQNSFVNYTPINAELKQRITRLNEARYEANRRGQTADVADIDKLLGEAWQGFQFAPQKSVLLPPEFLDTAYTGGMPGYIQPLIRPEPGTTASEMLTHFSHSPDLQMLDPTRYGTGIKGREMERLLGTQNPVMERSYAYTGDPSRVRPEPGLGRFRYGTRSEGLYDLAADPLLLRTLAAEANRTPFTAKYNKGMADPTQAFTDVERMAKEYGYEGLMNPQQGTAILYRPTPVQPFAKGGAVKPIKEGLKKGIKGALEMAEPMVNRISMSFKDVTKRVPELTEAAQAVSRGDMSADEYDRLVRRYKPVTPYEFVPEPASAEDAMRALTENKRPMFGKTSEMSPGERADLRLDIPAYKDHGVWVNSIHRKDAPTVYGSVSSVKNATMIGSPEKAMKVATGETPKAPFAVIRGDWNPMTESEAVKAAKQYLNHPEWRQVGYDPERHGYFYDRATMEPILGAEEVIQIGPLVLARKPQFGKKSEQKYQFGGAVKPVKEGLKKAIKGALEVLSPAETEANKASFLADSAVQQRMYTGTSKDKDFPKFSVPRNGAWFTPSTDVASLYAKENDSKGLRYDPDTRQFKEINTADRVMPVYLRAVKPYQVTDDDMKRMNVDNYKKAQSQFFDSLRAQGHDSAIFSDGTTVILGGPHQIKSAIGNRGTFDTREADMNKRKGGLAAIKRSR